MSKRLTFLMGAATGAGLMYLLDPQGGGRRRALAHDQLVSAQNSLQDWLSGTQRDLGNRAQGMMAELDTRMQPNPASDRVLAERVRSELGRASTHSGSIKVRADQGDVTLTGPILKEEVDRVIGTTYAVPGVKKVTDHLDVHEQPDNLPGLQS